MLNRRLVVSGRTGMTHLAAWKWLEGGEAVEASGAFEV